MGVALWRRDAEPASLPLPIVVQSNVRYRIEVFGEARAPWRATAGQAMLDAIRLDLANWDDARQEHFLAVPVDLRVDHPE
jgi:hypothetical protein